MSGSSKCAIYVCCDLSIPRRPRPARVSERLRSDDSNSRRAIPFSPSAVTSGDRDRTTACPAWQSRVFQFQAKVIFSRSRPSSFRTVFSQDEKVLLPEMPLQRFGHRRRAFLNNSLIAGRDARSLLSPEHIDSSAPTRKVAISVSPSCGDRDSALRSLRRTLWPSRPGRHCPPGVPWTPGCRGIQSPSGNSEGRPLPER
jgi:hypothetical protein